MGSKQGLELCGSGSNIKRAQQTAASARKTATKKRETKPTRCERLEEARLERRQMSRGASVLLCDTLNIFMQPFPTTFCTVTRERRGQAAFGQSTR